MCNGEVIEKITSYLLFRTTFFPACRTFYKSVIKPVIFIFNINRQARSARTSPISGTIYAKRLPGLQGIEGGEIFMELSYVN